MMDSLERLLAELFDFEGTLPPATVSLIAAQEEFGRLRDETDWVRRLAVPAELLAQLPAKSSLDEVSLAVLAQRSANEGEWDAFRAAEAEWLNETQVRCPWLAVDAYEVAAPSFLPFERVIRDLSGFQDADVFIEIRLDGTVDDRLEQLADAEWPLAKAFVTGGDSASTLALATFIHTALALEVPFKLAGGLDHALYRVDGPGVLNVFGATVLGIAHDLTKAELVDVLTSANRGDWRFTDETMIWSGLEADAEDVEEARNMLDAIGISNLAELDQEFLTLFGAEEDEE